jgi:hypothetical protein
LVSLALAWLQPWNNPGTPWNNYDKNPDMVGASSVNSIPNFNLPQSFIPQPTNNIQPIK